MGSLIKANEFVQTVGVLYTGGTIGMTRNEHNVLAPKPNELARQIRKFSMMHDASYPIGDSWLVLPFVEDQPGRVVYKIVEYDPLLDSSNMSATDWSRIARDIQSLYDSYSGFVVLHGTDTLAYTASVLSFMLQNLGKTVIVTGSQIPIFDTRSDGRDNFTSALIMAGYYRIPEVCVVFDRNLYRGNRTMKINCDSFRAFDSPNMEPLATMGVNIKVNKGLIRSWGSPGESFSVLPKLESRVALVELFPTISGTALAAFLKHYEGVVLKTYGSGNIASNQKELIQAIRNATARGVLIVNVTQCCAGTVCAMYEASQPLQECGVIPGLDMTAVAAFAKLCYVLGQKDWDLETKKLMLRRNLRGELTDPEGREEEEEPHQNGINDNNIN